MRKFHEAFQKSAVSVAVVTFDKGPLAEAYVSSTGLEWPLLVDERLSLYRAYQMERASWWAIYGPVSVWHYLQLLWNGRRLARPGRDWRQLGGDVLIDPAGIVRQHYISTTPHDRPTPEEILAIVRNDAHRQTRRQA